MKIDQKLSKLEFKMKINQNQIHSRLQPEQILVCNEVDQKKKKKIHACK
jgi:hypothetical protein